MEGRRRLDPEGDIVPEAVRRAYRTALKRMVQAAFAAAAAGLVTDSSR